MLYGHWPVLSGSRRSGTVQHVKRTCTTLKGVLGYSAAIVGNRPKIELKKSRSSDLITRSKSGHFRHRTSISDEYRISSISRVKAFQFPALTPTNDAGRKTNEEVSIVQMLPEKNLTTSSVSISPASTTGTQIFVEKQITTLFPYRQFTPKHI